MYEAYLDYALPIMTVVAVVNFMAAWVLSLSRPTPRPGIGLEWRELETRRPAQVGQLIKNKVKAKSRVA